MGKNKKPPITEWLVAISSVIAAVSKILALFLK